MVINTNCHWRRWIPVALLGIVISGPAISQDYPAKPVTIVVPYGPGGNADLSARALAAAIQTDKLMDQSIVVENREGAGGIVATQYVQRSAKDGYTLLLARIGSQVVAPALNPTTPYKWDDLAPLGLIEIDPFVCVVKADSPIKTFKDLLAAVRSNPGKLNYASTGPMDTTVVFPIKAFLDSGLPANAATKVPYKGGGAAMAAVVGGVVDFGCNALAPYLGPIKSGTLRPLVVTTPARISDLPDTPTVAEIGMKQLEMVSGWNALYGPPGLPKQVVDYWTRVLARINTSPTWLETVKRRGTIPSIMSPDDTHKFVRDQFAAYSALSNVIGPDK